MLAQRTEAPALSQPSLEAERLPRQSSWHARLCLQHPMQTQPWGLAHDRKWVHAHRPQGAVQRSQSEATLPRSGCVTWGDQAGQRLIPDLAVTLIPAAVRRPLHWHFLSLDFLAVSWLRALSPLFQGAVFNHLQGSFKFPPEFFSPGESKWHNLALNYTPLILLLFFKGC